MGTASPASSPAASSAGTRAGCARSTGGRLSAWVRLVTWLPPYLDEATVAGAAARAIVGIERVTPYRISPPVPGGLIFGYATVNEQAIAEGADILTRVTGQLQHPPDLPEIDNAARAITLVQDGGEAPGGPGRTCGTGRWPAAYGVPVDPQKGVDIRSPRPHIHPANGRE
jgi:hypothetical protein